VSCGRRERLRVWADQVWKVAGRSVKVEVGVGVVVVAAVVVVVVVLGAVRVRRGPQ
jgi:hypothetical protein